MAERALATAYVNIVPGTKAVEQYLKTGLSGQAAGAGADAGGKFGSGFKSRFASAARGLMGPLVASLSVGAATQFLSGAVQGASDLGEQLSATRAVFKGGSQDVENFAAGAAAKLGQTRTQIFEAAKSFGVFGKAAGLSEKENANFSTSLVSLATDLASFNNTSVDEALTALGSGLRGEAEPLRRFGVLLDDATLRQQALEMGLIKTTKQALTPQQKVLAANAAIFEQTSTQQGDFARTSGGLANQQRILGAAFADAQASLGQMLLPTITNLVTYLNTNVIPAVSTFIQNFKDGKTPLNDFFTGISNVINFIKTNWTWISTLAVAVGTLVAGWKIYNGVILLWQNIMKIGTAIQAAYNVVMAANPIVLIIIAVLALVAALIWFFTQTELGKKIWKGFTDFMSTAIKAVGDFFVGLWNGIVGFFQGVGKTLSDVWNGFVGFLVGAWNGIKGAFEAVFKFIGGLFTGYVNFWLGIFEGFINFFVDGINGLIKGVNTGLGFLGDLIGTEIQVGYIPKVNLPRLAKGGFVDQPTTALIGEAGPEVVTPLKDFERMMGIGDNGSGSERPIYADGIGLLGWIREEAKGQATLVFNDELGKVTRGAR
jgi:hypothetical protein